MSVKGSWSRVKDQKRYAANMDEIRAKEKKRAAAAKRLADALAVTGGHVVKPKKRGA